MRWKISAFMLMVDVLCCTSRMGHERSRMVWAKCCVVMVVWEIVMDACGCCACMTSSAGVHKPINQVGSACCIRGWVFQAFEHVL